MGGPLVPDVLDQLSRPRADVRRLPRGRGPHHRRPLDPGLCAGEADPAAPAAEQRLLAGGRDARAANGRVPGRRGSPRLPSRALPARRAERARLRDQSAPPPRSRMTAKPRAARRRAAARLAPNAARLGGGGAADRRGPRWQAVGTQSTWGWVDQSGVMPLSWISAPSRAVSSRNPTVASAALPPTGTAPMSMMRCRTAGSARTVWKAALNASIIVGGVPAGATSRQAAPLAYRAPGRGSRRGATAPGGRRAIGSVRRRAGTI